MLQNANTKCNGLLPIWGPEISETNFSSSLARHNNFIQECTGIFDHSYHLLAHDLRLLLLRFAYEKSFSAESGGGGPQSNLHLVPYLMHVAVYVMNTYVCCSRGCGYGCDVGVVIYAGLAVISVKRRIWKRLLACLLTSGSRLLMRYIYCALIPLLL